jgi:hypothetical protein
MRRFLALCLVTACCMLCAAALAEASLPEVGVPVSVSGEFIELPAKAAASLQVEAAPKGQKADPHRFVVSTVDAAGLKTLKARIEAAGPKVVNSPVISVRDGTHGKVSIGSVLPYKDENGKQQFIRIESGFGVTPRVNADGSITLAVTVTLADTPKQTTVAATQTVSAGGAMIFIRGDDGTGKGLVIVFTPKVGDEAVRPRPAADLCP